MHNNREVVQDDIKEVNISRSREIVLDVILIIYQNNLLLVNKN